MFHKIDNYIKIADLRRRLKIALAENQTSIEEHIQSVTAEGRTTGIEKSFSMVLHDQFEKHGDSFRCEVPLTSVGLKTAYPWRTSGFLDSYFPAEGGAMEYKAVRLPRTKSDPRFDAGQISADYERLNNPHRLSWGYLIAFCHGPLVPLCKSDSALYRAFHNQMFVDCNPAAGTGDRYYAGRQVEELRWDSARQGAMPTWATAVRAGSMGAVAISVFEQA
ncbi:hypothetical protein N8D56_25710 (plasmid) [Devosia sp. A8/3-2]|nr:hypothetical protein N8D56_25710 [Devosia sp. A8/3-2]